MIMELGYPDHKMLVKWAREYERTRKIKEGYVANRYSQEEKQEAVDFYLKHGKQTSYTIRSLGYPSRQKLMEWIDELAPGERIIHDGCLKRDKHPSMEKKDYIMRLATRTVSAEEVAKEAGVSRSSLYT